MGRRLDPPTAPTTISPPPKKKKHTHTHQQQPTTQHRKNNTTQQATELFKLLAKYRPESKVEKKERLKQLAAAKVRPWVD
jgi:hypothetical protein